MSLLNVPKLVDYRNKVARHKTKKYGNRTNGVKSITDIAIHHSLTLRKLAGSNAEGYARYHVDSLGWPSIGYTYVIEADGTIKYVNDIEKLTYHVGDHNNYAVGIVLSGDFTQEKPTKEQEGSLRNLVAALKKKYPHIKNIKGHSDYKGYEWKACPVFDYKKVLEDKGTSKPTETKPVEKPKPPTESKPKGDMKTTSIVNYLKSIKQPSSFSHRAKLAKQHGIKFYMGTASQNTKLLNLLRKGGTSVSKPPTTNTPKTFKVGQKVKIKSSADKYSRANVSIPARYKNKAMTIQQVGKDDVLIKEVYSWVKKAHVE